MEEHLNPRQPADIARALAEREEHVVQALLALPVAKAGLTLYKLDAVMNGDLDEIVDALTAEDQARLLAEMVG